MSKKCEIKQYIQNITSDIKEQTRLNDIHNNIFKELHVSKNYNLHYDGMLWEKDIVAGYVKEVNSGRKLVLDINKKYNNEVVGWDKSRPTNKRYLFVNVKNLLYKDPNQTTLFQLEPDNKVNFDLKVVDKLQSNISKVNGWFKQMKDTDAFWKKVQSDLAIPKEQVELLRQSEGETIEQKLVNFVANYSQTIEVNTARDKEGLYDPTDIDNFDPDALYTNKKSSKNTPTQHYSNLTVPGGTNYTENEIATPAITPNIKGHAEFSTDNGIGWFRSDDRTHGGQSSLSHSDKVETNGEWDRQDEGFSLGSDKYTQTTISEVGVPPEFWDTSYKNGINISNDEYYEAKKKSNISIYKNEKTRRILEVQSDLFQKGRDKKRLTDYRVSGPTLITSDDFFKKIKNEYNRLEADDENPFSVHTELDIEGIKVKNINGEWYRIRDNEEIFNKDQNNFLQLLNKDSNWVTFFVKSIIQDSAKKGYEKVLFPTGNTSVKIESPGTNITTIQEAKNANQNSLANTGLFYENTVTNILNKTYGKENIKQITDEFGNTWNEITLTSKNLENILLQTKPKETVSKKNAQLEQAMMEFATINGIKVEFIPSLVERFGGDYSAAYDSINKVIYINENKADLDTFPEEIGHVLTLALGNDHVLVKKAFNLLSKTDYKSTLDPKYVALYKNNEDALKHEVIGKMIAQVLVQKYEPKTETEFKLFHAIMQLIDKFISMFKRNDRLEDVVQSLAAKITSKEQVFVGETKVTGANSIYFQVEPTYKALTNFPMQAKNFINLEKGYKKATIRLTKYPSGFYKFGKSVYRVDLVNPDMSKASDIADIKELKKQFTDSDIEHQHIKDFFSGEKPAYIYNITKLSLEEQAKYKAEEIKSKSKIEDKNQYVYLKQQLNKDLKTLNKLEYDSPEHVLLRDKVDKNTKALAELEASGNRQIIIDLGTEMLDNLERLLNDYEDVDKKIKLDNITIAASFETFKYFKVFPPLAQRSLELENRLSILSRISMLEDINLRALEGREITADEAFGITEDIGSIKGAFAKLSNSSNYIARTIHLMIKEVQDNVSNQDKQTNKLIKSEVELLREWSKANNITEKEMYNIFIQDHRGSTILTRQFTSEFYEMIDKSYKMNDDKGKSYRNSFAKWDPTIKMFLPKSNNYINSDYTKIQKIPALKKFYDFHKKLVKEAAAKLPVKIDPEFIANIASNNLLDAFKVDAITKSDKLMEMASNLTGINIKQFQDGTFALDEGLFQDIIPMQFVASLDKSKKSYNLGDNLNTFVKFANNYEQMSNVLPTIRTMQNQLGKQSFIKSNDPNKAIEGLNSDTGVKANIYEFVNTVIEMQVKGNMKKDQGTVKTTAILDKDGNVTGYNYIHGSHIADFGMKYNSLLRIGLNPINAITNLIIGDLGNIIEGFGNRFYSLTNLKDASNIFFKDVMKEDSDLNKWRELIGPLQEYDDYEGIKQESTSKNIFTKENIEKIMFAPQKGGEIWLQNRTMIAMLIKDGLMNPDGTSTPKGVSISKVDLQRLRNKIHDVNDKIHGRYSARDAAAITQNVLGRMALQFKKWIPAAIESRFEAYSFNNDLGMEVEGRYIVGFRLMVRALKGDLKALQAGNMTELELYSMRKNLAELTLALGTILMFAALGSFGDDDDELKKNPYYKFTMDQLNRVSGDLLYFVNPVSATELVLKPIALAKTTSDLLHAVIAIPHIFNAQGKKDIYASGSRKGENKALAKLIDLTPGAAPVARVLRNFKDIKYQSPK